VGLSPEAQDKQHLQLIWIYFYFAQVMRLMNQVLLGLLWDRCLVYNDAILIFHKDSDTTLENLCSVLNRIASFGLQLKSCKCHLFCTQISFLGHVVGRDGLVSECRERGMRTVYVHTDDIKRRSPPIDKQAWDNKSSRTMCIASEI
jgi:hypothetical protein